jgi:hypothetical protein
MKQTIINVIKSDNYSGTFMTQEAYQALTLQMSNRIKQSDLDAVVDRINRITGSPQITWVKNKNGKFKAQIGNYHLDYAYGGVALHRIMTDGGGVDDVIGGHRSKRELYNLMQSFIKGLSHE